MSEHRPQDPADDLVNDARELSQNVRKVGSDIQHIYSSASERVNLGRIYRGNPFAILGVAAGVGYVLGGGLFTPFTARLLKIGARAVVIPMLASQLETALQGTTPDTPPQENP